MGPLQSVTLTGASAFAKELKGSRFAPWKNPDKLTERQQAKLAWVATLNGPLYRPWLLEEELLQVFALKVSNAIAESTDTKLRVLMRAAFGYRDTDGLIAMAMLARGGICPGCRAGAAA